MSRRLPRPRRQRQAGFTLIELMISLVLFSFAIAGVLSVAVSLANGFREQRLAVETESAARGAMEFLADAIRGASPGVSTGDILHTNAACGGQPPAFLVVNSATAPDELIVAFASGSVVTSSATAYDGSGTSMTVDDASQLADGDTLLVTDFNQGHLVTLNGPPSGNDLTLDSASCVPATAYGSGSLVIRAQRARFYIDPNFDGIGPTLMMELPDGTVEPLADGVEDMQIAIAREDDTPADGIQETGLGAGDDDWIYNFPGEVDTVDPIRAVRITLVARGREPMTGTAAFYRPTVEDRAGAGAPDSYRRRVLTSIIEIRNLGGSP